jgi:hypothetical protein
VSGCWVWAWRAAVAADPLGSLLPARARRIRKCGGPRSDQLADRSSSLRCELTTDKLTTGAGCNDIEFSFYSTNGSAQASGDLFILTQLYLGTPSGWSAATPGCLARSTGVAGGQWRSAAGVSLL